MHTSSDRGNGFTLIELLVVIAIVAILSVVVILTLNPAELLRQSRDSNRLADMTTINTGMGLFVEDLPINSMGIASTTYLSIADPAATSTAGDQCQGLGLSFSAPSGTVYHCSASSTLRNVDGTGWLPPKFSSMSIGSPFALLSIDPTNTTSSGLYYSYNGITGQFQINAHFESQKYASVVGKSGSADPAIYSIGNNLSLAPWADNMVGYWAFNEGNGTVAFDSSGMGFNGTWSGTPTGTSGYYSAGKVGAYAGAFDGITDVINLPALNMFNEKPFSITLWVYPTISKTDEGLFGACAIGNDMCLHLAIRLGVPYFGFYTDDMTGGSVPLNTWSELAFTYTGGPGGVRTIYVNGNQAISGISVAGLQVPNGTTSTIGQDLGTYYHAGLIDELRVYNRALSASEVAAFYATGK